jgi:hypothetical protein
MKMITPGVVPVLAVAAGVTLAASGAAWAAGGAGTAGGARTGAPSASGPAPGTSASGPLVEAPSSEPGRFYAVAATSAGNAWAVGLQGGTGLIMRWSSRSGVYRWRVSSTQPTGFLFGVAATSVSSAWAVGGTDWFSPQTLAEHWNGTTWTQAATPTPGGSAYFEGVAATSRSNAWAVGLIGPGPGVQSPTTPLIEHWNGTTWTQQHVQEPAGGGSFSSVAAISATDAWAVGHIGQNNLGPWQTLIEHWNGRNWTIVPSPNPSSVSDGLAGVSASSARNVWAAGSASNGTTNSTLMEHWNGSKWAVVPSPTPTGDVYLIGVAVGSPTDAWAVGYTRPTTCSPLCGTAALHWNGKRWAVVPTVNPPGSGLSTLEGVVIISPSNAWAVGTAYDWSATVVEHWNGSNWVWHLPS